MSISFLEANNIASTENNLASKKFVLATSCQTEKLDVFIKASCILKGFNCEYTTLPFNTLQQYISTTPDEPKTHVFILFPWDILPEADWRTGVSHQDITLEQAINRIGTFLEQLEHFKPHHIIYIPATMLPVNLNHTINQQIELQLSQALLEYNSVIADSDFFSLSSYLSNGSGFSSKHLSNIASEISQLLTQSTTTKKIIITDLDNVMWKGVVAEDGLDGIDCSQEGSGYVHYIYQSLLRKLKSQGILIAGVTRNDLDSALSPFRENKTLFNHNDFVTVVASYYAKSSQIRTLLDELNLPDDSAVFIDDNPVELEEVKTRLPTIACLPFPSKNEIFPVLVSQLQKFFNIQSVTEDDKNRTELYKTRYNAQAISTAKGADLSEYLSTLKMQITVIKCNSSNSQRALQLINKTNQFNLNGKRMTQPELNDLLKNKCHLYSFALTDKYGDHGQIASLLLSSEHTVHFFVMSCRVFQREIEYAIISWLIKKHNLSTLNFDFLKTDKNIPFRIFIDKKMYSKNNKHNLSLDSSLFLNAYEKKLKLFNIIEGDE